jgi:hypothetical protein
MDVTVAIGTERDQIFVCVVSRRHKQRSDRRGDGFRSCGISYVRVHFAPERRRLAFVSVLARRFKDRDVIAARRSGGHILGTCTGRRPNNRSTRSNGPGEPERLTFSLPQEGHLCFAFVTGPDMRPTCYQSLLVFSILTACSRFLGCTPASSCLLYCGLVGRPLKRSLR